MKSLLYISALLIAGSIFASTPKHEEMEFLKRNPDYVARLIALTSPEREIEAERIYHSLRLNIIGENETQRKASERQMNSMIAFWQELSDQMPENSFLYRIAFETQDGKIACEGWVVLKEGKTIKRELVKHMEVDLN